MAKHASWSLVLLIVAVTTESFAWRARGSVVTPDEVKMGSLLIRPDVGRGYVRAPGIDTTVRIRVTGLVARTRVIQNFRNPAEESVEAIYVFPLPKRAAVDGLRMTVGERVIEGQLQERDRAREIYERAKREGKQASLLEQQRPTMFTVSLAHLGPLETVRIELEYQEEIRYEAGRFHLRFPMVVGPRHVPGAPASIVDVGLTGTGAQLRSVVGDADRIAPPVLPSSTRRENSVEIDVELNLGMPLASLESLSHEVTVEHRVAFGYRVSFRDGVAPAERDFVLRWAPEVGSAPRAALFSENVDGANYVLLMLLPPDSREAARLPRETIFVIDTSGSMHGASIAAARDALATALDRLQPNDTFNIIQFSSTTSRLSVQPVRATPEAVARAHDYVAGLEAQGGTEMLRALESAFTQQSPPEIQRVRQILFVTDGSVGNESELYDYIQSHLTEQRLFTVGIGSAPNAHFMSRAAAFGRGTFTYIGSSHDVSSRMEALIHKIESPVLSHVELAFEDPKAEMWPRRVPDLYTDEPIVIVAKLQDMPSGLDLRARRGEQPWGVAFQLRGSRTESGISKLWARRKIAELMAEMSVSREISERDDARAGIIDVALRHRLVSRFTGLVAADISKRGPSGARAETKAVPTAIQFGWSQPHVVGTLPRGGTGAELWMLAGFIALIVGLLIYWSGDRSCERKRSVLSLSR